jgi:hypothetical protein
MQVNASIRLNMTQQFIATLKVKVALRIEWQKDKNKK